MMTIELPKLERIRNSIKIEDYKPTSYQKINNEHRGKEISQEYIPKYCECEYQSFISLQNECVNEYYEWLSHAPKFIDIKII